MKELELVVLSLRYSSWSIRPWLALQHAGAEFQTRTVVLPHLGMQKQAGAVLVPDTQNESLSERRATGSVTGLYPVLYVGGSPVHEALAICEWAAEAFPGAGLWPDDMMERALARSLSCEMATGFGSLRQTMSCHVFARVPDFVPDENTTTDITRIFEIWSDCLQRSGGPFLFGRFSVVDCMYFPVVTRFETYGIELPVALEDYRSSLFELPAVRAWAELAKTAPPVPIYDEHIRSLGGGPTAAMPV